MMETKKHVADEVKIIAVIQARANSKRLPAKVLKTLLGKSLIEWMNYRLSFSKEISDIVLATSDHPENDILEEHAKKIGLQVLRGSESDLISRYSDVAKTYKADAVIRCVGDCPLIDPEMIDNLIKVYKKNKGNVDFVCNNNPPTYPHGMDIEIIDVEALKKLDRNVKDPLYREWLTMTIIENPKDFNIINIKNSSKNTDIRLTVDYEEDLILVEKILQSLHNEGEIFHLKEILSLFEKNSELKKINAKWLNNEMKDNVRKNSDFQSLKKNHNV